MKSLPFCLCLAVYVVAVTAGAFNGGMWAALAIGLALLLFFIVAATDRKFPLPPRDMILFVVVVLAVCAVELPLSAYPAISHKTWLQLASIFVPLSLLAAPRLRQCALAPRFFPVTGAALAMGALALALELHSGGYLLHRFKNPTEFLTQYNRGMAHLAILAFPLLAGLWLSGSKKAAMLLVAALLFPAALTELHTAKFALIAGCLAAALAFMRPAWVAAALSSISLILAGLPFYVQKFFIAHYDAVERLPASWRHRVEIWDYLSYRILERPIFGWGLGTTHKLDYTQPHGLAYQVVDSPAPHAHNFIIQIWVETGLIGLLCGLAFMLLSLRQAYRMTASVRPFALGCWTAALIVSLFGFDFWTDSLWGAFALSAFAFALLRQMLERNDNLLDA